MVETFADDARSVLSGSVRIASMFSGIGTEVCASAMLEDHLCVDGQEGPTFVDTCTFEVRKAARSALQEMSSCALFGDILSLLPETLQAWVREGGHSLELLKRRIFDSRPAVARTMFCHRSGTMVDVDLGSILVCGIPCIDFSPMGLRRGLGGPSGALICGWMRIVLEFEPAVLLIEEVPGFVKHGLPFIAADSALGATYSFESAMLNPRDLGLPVSRPRAYCVACHKRQCLLARPFSEVTVDMPRRTRTTDTGLEYFYLPLPDAVLTQPQRRRLEGYTRRFGFGDNA